jgi:hypothetical protein
MTEGQHIQHESKLTEQLARKLFGRYLVGISAGTSDILAELFVSVLSPSR